MQSRERVRYLLMISVVAICAALLVVIFFYDRSSSPPELIDDVVMDADVALSEFNYTETENGVARWTLTADSAAHAFSSDMTVMQNVRLQLFDQEEAGDVVLTAKTGKANFATSDVNVRGDVIITTQNGYRFESDSVVFHGDSLKDGVVVTDDFVHIYSDQLEITGIGMRVDLSASTFILKHNVIAVYLSLPSKGE
ncbi:MAG: LPS export ABC transporter periplasmic protein LptC [Thermodesulfobacteriota bacterium]|nr:LPS export ABC transporter periplasmic protein LptC [Thermodesulfobacteriota bacterium]